MWVADVTRVPTDGIGLESQMTGIISLNSADNVFAADCTQVKQINLQ